MKASLVWRWWIRRPTTEEDLSHGALGSGVLPGQCRIQLSLNGFEWHLYNRTSAYENLMAQMKTDGQSSVRVPTPSTSPQDAQDKSSNRLLGYKFFQHVTLNLPPLVRSVVGWMKKQMPKLDPRELLPLGIDATRGVIVLGNPSTPSLLVAEFHQADGGFGIVPVSLGVLAA